MNEYVIIQSGENPAIVHRGSGYDGMLCAAAGVPPGKVYTDALEAERDAARLTSVSRTGFWVKELMTLQDLLAERESFIGNMLMYAFLIRDIDTLVYQDRWNAAHPKEENTDER